MVLTQCEPLAGCSAVPHDLRGTSMARPNWRPCAVIFAASIALSNPASAQLGHAVPVPPQPPGTVVVPADSNHPSGPVVVQPVNSVPPAGPVVILPAPPGGATARPVPGGHFQLIAREFFVRHQTRDDAP